MRKVLLNLLVVASCAVSFGAFAAGHEGHAPSHSGAGRSHDHSGEGSDMNNNPDYRAATPIAEVESGPLNPHDRGFGNFMYFNEVTRDHH